MRQTGQRRVKPTWVMLWARHPFCWICEADGLTPAECYVPPSEASVDHIIPMSRGGQDDIRNTALAHKACNSLRGDNMPSPESLRAFMVSWGWAPVHNFIDVVPGLRTILQAHDPSIVFG